MIQIIVLLEVNDRAAFHEYEMKAFKIMKEYEGRLLTAFEPDVHESSSCNINEIHHLQFPNIMAFNKYRSDSQLAGLSTLRELAISNTIIYVSDKIKDYKS